MLPKGKKMRPLVSEFQAYCSFLSEPALEAESNSFFKQQPKGSRVMHRHLQWEKFGSMVQQFFGRRRQKKRSLMTNLQQFLTWRANSSKQSFALQGYQGNLGFRCASCKDWTPQVNVVAFEPRDHGNAEREL